MFIRFNEGENGHIENIARRVISEEVHRQGSDLNDFLTSLARRIVELDVRTKSLAPEESGEA